MNDEHELDLEDEITHDEARAQLLQARHTFQVARDRLTRAEGRHRWLQEAADRAQRQANECGSLVGDLREELQGAEGEYDEAVRTLARFEDDHNDDEQEVTA